MKTEITQTNKIGNISLHVVAMIVFIAAFADYSHAITDALKIKIEGMSYSDETVIRFIPGATPEFDGSWDAYKLFSPISNAPNLFTKTPTGDVLSINSLPSLSTTNTADLFLQIGQIGNYTITSKELGAFGDGTCITLFDQATGNLYNLRDTTARNTFHISVTSKNDPARFVIIFSLPATVTSANASCKNCKNGNAVIKKAGWTDWQYAIKDSSGMQIISGTALNENVTIEGLLPGKYSVIVQAQKFTCTDSVIFNVDTISNGLGTNNISFSSQCKFSYHDGAFRIETNFNEPKDFTAQIIDMEGKVIWKKEYSNTKELNNTIEIGNPTSGIYSGVIQGNDFSSVKKIALTH